MQRQHIMVGVGFWLLVAMFMAMFAMRAHAQGEDEAWQAFHGQVVISDIMIAPAEAFDSGATMVAALHRVERNTVGAREGFWRLHAVAFLDPVLTSGVLRLRALDVTGPNQRDQVRVFDVRGEAGQKVVPLPDLVLTAAMGFKAGHKYELAIERIDDQPTVETLPVAGAAPAAASGKADVCAKGMITLR
jgi:hypothetical protein